jgi:hypothetical protein
MVFTAKEEEVLKLVVKDMLDKAKLRAKRNADNNSYATLQIEIAKNEKDLNDMSAE